MHCRVCKSLPFTNEQETQCMSLFCIVSSKAFDVPDSHQTVTQLGQCEVLSSLACCAGALLWFCCRRRRRQQSHPGGKLPSSHQSSPSWGKGSAAALISRPFRKAPPKNLVASKAVDLSPSLADPEQPSFTSGLHPAGPAPDHTLAQFYTQHISVSHPAEAASSPAAYQTAGKAADLPVGLGAGGVQHEGLDRGGMPHSDSAVSLPSNASSVQGPATPIAPAMVAAGQFAACTFDGKQAIYT